jgi:hypothetical protein
MEPSPVTQKFIEALNAKFADRKTIFGPVKFDVIVEEKYDKITLPQWNGLPHGSAHAFVERETGKVFKAASWRYSAIKAKYDLNEEEDFNTAVERSDPYGYYLETRNRNKSYTDPFGNEVYGASNPEKQGY